jgi:hypothetical protein
MTNVFISHASQDKPRLVPYLLAILRSIPEDVCLFIDTPEDLGTELGESSRIVGIKPGADWRREITRAIEESCCVVVFWSSHVVARRGKVLEHEIDVARKTNKCIPVCIDAMRSLEIPPPYYHDQILDVSRFGQQQDDQMFLRIVRTIERFIGEHRKTAEVQSSWHDGEPSVIYGDIVFGPKIDRSVRADGNVQINYLARDNDDD